MAINFSASFAACLAAGLKVPRQFMYCIAQDTGAPYVVYKDSGGGAGGDWGEFPQSPEPSLQPSPSPPYHNSATPGVQQPPPAQQQLQQPGNFTPNPTRDLTPHRPPPLVHPGSVEDEVSPQGQQPPQQQPQSQQQQQQQQQPPQQPPQPPSAQQPPQPQPPQQQQSTQTQQTNPPQPTPQQELGVGCDLSQSYYGGGRGTQHMLSQGFMSYLKQPVVLTSLNPNDPVPDYTGFHMTTGMPDLLSGSLKASPVSGVAGVKSELRLFKCLTCGKDFKQKSTLLQHERIHTDSRPYGCSECGKRFRQQSHLTQHLRIHANEKPFACIYCERTFRQRAILNQHLRIHSDVSPHLVYKNGQLWPQDVPFPQEENKGQGFDLQQDSQCFSPDSQFPAYFKDSKETSSNLPSEVHEQNFPSHLSSETHCKSFPNGERSQTHPESFDSKTLSQTSGSDEFPNRVPPVAHQDEVSNKTPPEAQRVDFLSRFSSEGRPTNFSTRTVGSQCDDIGNRFLMSREEFNSRLSSDVEDDDYSNPLPADLSSPRDIRGVAHGVFGTGNGKTLPEMIQSGRNAGLPLYVRCPICQKEFKQKSTLLQHGCIHIESRPYPCGECGKRFRQQSHLTQHLRIHTNEKPYGCLYCGRNFRQRTILNQHVRIHTGEKPYKCAQCGKDFRQKAILDQHTRTHQGDRPYCCPLPNCRRRFAAEAEVKRHVENHVGPKRKPPPPGVSMNPTPLVKPELYLPQCYTHPGNFQQQYAMSQLLGSTPPQPTALVQ